jgi:hypothetical protein
MHSLSNTNDLKFISLRRRAVPAVHDETREDVRAGGAAAHHAEQWRRPLTVRRARANRTAGIDGIAGASRCNLRIDLTVIGKVSASTRSHTSLVVAPVG